MFGGLIQPVWRGSLSNGIWFIRLWCSLNKLVRSALVTPPDSNTGIVVGKFGSCEQAFGNDICDTVVVRKQQHYLNCFMCTFNEILLSLFFFFYWYTYPHKIWFEHFFSNLVVCLCAFHNTVCAKIALCFLKRGDGFGNCSETSLERSCTKGDNSLK